MFAPPLQPHPTWQQRLVRPHPRDLSAGLCVAGLLLPEAVAYAGLAHLPVAHALTAMMWGLALYALFGGSRFAIVAPTSSSAALAAAAAVTVATPGSADFVPALMGVTLLAGLALMLLAVGRQGQLSAYVSRPVLRGFSFALALTIVIKQLPDALGVAPTAAASPTPLHLLLDMLRQAPHWHAPTLVVAALAATLLLLLRRWPALPASLLVIVLAVLGAQSLDLAALGVKEVGPVAPPSWQLALPQLRWDDWVKVAELAFGLVILLFAESWGSVRGLALLHGDSVHANRELLVLGACNAGAALLQGMPVGAGFSASQANASAGAQSKWAGAVALGVVALALAFAAPELHALPRPVLAVAVMAALAHALEPNALISTWRTQRDRVLLLGAVLAVLLFGVLHGMLAAIGLSLLAALRRFSQPVLHELGELGQTRNFVVIDEHADAQRIPGLMILRPEEPLFFASAERVVSEVAERAMQASPRPRCVILSLEESSDLDSTALECLMELDLRLRSAGITLVLSRVKDRVRELLTRCAPAGLGEPARMHFSVADAAQALRQPR